MNQREQALDPPSSESEEISVTQFLSFGKFSFGSQMSSGIKHSRIGIHSIIITDSPISGKMATVSGDCERFCERSSPNIAHHN